MGIFDLLNSFNGGADKATGSGEQSQPPTPDVSGGNPTIPGNATVKPDGKGPSAFPDVASKTGEQSPLAGFEDLWKTASTDAKQLQSFVPTMNVDMSKLMAAASTLDYSKVLSPELIQKATSGDAVAFTEAVALVGKATWANSAAATSKIVEAALQRQADTFRNEFLPDVLRRERINNTMTQDNPIFTNPAVAPLFDMVRERLAQKFPSADAKEISSKAQEYMSGFASEFSKTQGKQVVDIPKPTEADKRTTDWEKFFSNGSSF